MKNACHFDMTGVFYVFLYRKQEQGYEILAAKDDFRLEMTAQNFRQQRG